MEQMNFWHSCAAPLGMRDSKGLIENYCKYCTGEDGKLKFRQDVQRGIAGWFKTRQPSIDDDLAMTGAGH